MTGTPEPNAIDLKLAGFLEDLVAGLGLAVEAIDLARLLAVLQTSLRKHGLAIAEYQRVEETTRG